MRTSPFRIASWIAAAFAVVVVSLPAAAAADPGEGPGGPILVVTGDSNPFGRYYAEILRNEGLNEFDVSKLSDVNAGTLAAHDVVILGETPLTGGQTSLLSDWVDDGGNLIAMRPDSQLGGLLGLSPNAPATTLSDGYLKVDTSAAPGAGIVGETIQFHGTADGYSLNGATEVAELYSDATTATGDPAVTLNSVGSNGGQAAAFTYDLARSVVYTRQGNPDWAGDERDGTGPLRSNDLFFGAKAGDVQDDWIDLDKVEIPQADEQQRLLANLIQEMNADRGPLPRFWYFPRDVKAAIVMTGDDHNTGGTAGRFDLEKAESVPGCVVADWECVRSTSYVFPDTPISSAEAYEADGFEIGLHPDTGCSDYTPAQFDTILATQLAEFEDSFPTIDAPVTNRNHCIAWSGWTEPAEGELAHGMRFDTNYYYWPDSWIDDRPGMFTGSGMPMRFADLDGSMIDVYQAATQMTDESGQSLAAHANTLLDNALGAKGYYGAFTANMHTDSAAHTGWSAIVNSAQARDLPSTPQVREVPIVSSRQMLEWIDARNASSFSSIDWSNDTLNFTIDADGAANGLRAMVPTQSEAGELTGVEHEGSPVTVTNQTIKGIEYAFFDGVDGSYVATYAPAPPPALSMVDDTTAEFSAGTTGSSTYVSESDDGEVILKPTEGSEFSGSTLPASWSQHVWNAGGGASVSGGKLSVDGARAGTTATYGSGRALEFRATFGSAPFAHIGLGVDYNAPPWAMFSIRGDGSFAARTDTAGGVGGGTAETALGNGYLGSPHTYRIEWSASDVAYYIDGVLVATHNVSFGAQQMRPLASDFQTGGGGLSIDWLRLTPYASSGTFISRVFDAGSAADWGSLDWDSDEPAGTALALSVRTGPTPTPDGSWTAFAPIASPGGDVPGNNRYAQYKAELSTGDTERTPVLSRVELGYQVAPPDTVDPEITIARPYQGARYSRFADPKPELDSDYSCSDADSGIASCVGTVADGAPFDRSSTGVKTFTVTATDNAGNTTSESVTYRVFTFAGLIGDSSPLAYYRLGDGAGSQTMAADAGPSGEYKNGQSSAPFGISGDGDTGRRFTGADGYGYANGITAPRSYTLSAFFRLDDAGRSQMIVQHGSAGAVWASGNRIRFRPVDWLGVELESPASLASGTWHHVAASYDWAVDPSNPQLGSGAAKLYLDGVLVDTGIGDRATSGTSTFYVGYGDKAPWLQGYLDEVAYFPAALTPTDVHEIWLADPPPVDQAPAGPEPAAPVPADPPAGDPPPAESISVAPGTPAEPTDGVTGRCASAQERLADATMRLKKAKKSKKKAKIKRARAELNTAAQAVDIAC